MVTCVFSLLHVNFLLFEFEKTQLLAVLPPLPSVVALAQVVSVVFQAQSPLAPPVLTAHVPSATQE